MVQTEGIWAAVAAVGVAAGALVLKLVGRKGDSPRERPPTVVTLSEADRACVREVKHAIEEVNATVDRLNTKMDLSNAKLDASNAKIEAFWRDMLGHNRAP